MAIVGFTFNKIQCEKKKSVQGKVNIGNNVRLLTVDKTPLHLGAKEQNAVKFEFEFQSTFEPAIGKIVLVGDVIYMESEEKVEKIVSEWKKTKKVPKEIMTSVLNNVLNKCNIEALILSREINLPSPIPLPRVAGGAAASKKADSGKGKKK